MREKIISCIFILSLIFVLASCSSTNDLTGRTPEQTPVQKQNLENKKPLTDAEKNALEEADLWVPAAKT